jgi:hypothetical protein
MRYSLGDEWIFKTVGTKSVALAGVNALVVAPAERWAREPGSRLALQQRYAPHNNSWSLVTDFVRYFWHWPAVFADSIQW